MEREYKMPPRPVLPPQVVVKTIDVLSQGIFEDYLKTRAESANFAADQISELTKNEALGDKVLALSFCLAKALETLATDVAPKVPHNLHGILITQEQHRFIIEKTMLSVAGKLLGRFMLPKYEEE